MKANCTDSMANKYLYLVVPASYSSYQYSVDGVDGIICLNSLLLLVQQCFLDLQKVILEGGVNK